MKLTQRSMHLLKSISDGQNRLFYLGIPYGWVQLERNGYATRVEGTDRASLTELGKKVIES